jgi:hypothetical protein
VINHSKGFKEISVIKLIWKKLKTLNLELFVFKASKEINPSEILFHHW